MILYHFSEDPSIAVFTPRTMETRPGEPARVWAVDEAHAPTFWLPRDCPRVCCWPMGGSTPGDIARFLGEPPARLLIGIEGGWLRRVREVALYAYHFAPDCFRALPPDQGSGYYVSTVPATPLAVEPLGDLLDRHVAAGVALRVVPSLWSLRDEILASTLDFGMIRMRNAQPDPRPDPPTVAALMAHRATP